MFWGVLLMFRLRSKRIHSHLLISIVVVVVCLLVIAIPFISKGYQDYQQARRTVLEIRAFISMADLSQKILGERNPNYFTSNEITLELEQQQLLKHQNEVDLQLQETIQILNQAGFHNTAKQLQHNIQPKLAHTRAELRADPELLNQSFEEMLNTWSHIHDLLKDALVEAQVSGLASSNHYALTLLLADLQDQASRVVSYAKMPVVYQRPLNETQKVTLTQAYKSSLYIWELVRKLQPRHERTVEFNALHQDVKHDFLNTVEQLLELAKQKKITVEQNEQSKLLTYNAIQNLGSVLQLQRYVLNKRLDTVVAQKRQTRQYFIVILLIVIICLLVALFTVIYARHRVFLPLIQAREMLLELIDPKCKQDLGDRVTLEDAIHKMEETLKHRDALAFDLKNIANTDALTGVANRTALEEYLAFTEQKPNAFEYMALIVLDIDNFKQVNDHYGHIVGDEVIQYVAHKLKKSVRSTDFVVRYGGDEFLVILENCEFSDALEIADKMRCAINHSQVFIPDLIEEISVSVSAGVAVGAQSWTQLLAKADKTLLRVKAQGKNAVEG